jgi:hypothetical protein
MRQTTTKSKTKIHPLCASVRTLKMASGWTLQEFALRAGVAQQTAYRFSAGLQIPKDPAVLIRLRDVAITLGLTNEANTFDYAAHGWNTMIPASGPPRLSTTTVLEKRSPDQARLALAAELAVSLFPDAAREAEEALAVPLLLVDKAFRELHKYNTVYDAQHYQRVKAKLDELVKQKLFPRAKKGDKQ